MRIILILIAFCFLALIFVGFLSIIIGKFKSDKAEKIAEGKKFAKEAAERNYKDKLKDAMNSLFETGVVEPIDLTNSISITQYGNSVLKNSGELANYMYSLTQDPTLDGTSSIIDEISNKKGHFNDEDFDRYNFVANYTKDKLLKQVKSIEENSKKYEIVFKDFDKLIKNAEKIIDGFKPVNTSDAYEAEIQNSRKANIELLRKKVFNLKKSKLYHQQAIAQLKLMLGLNNELVFDFDNIIHQMLPLIKNNASVESFKSLDIAHLAKSIEKLRKVQESKI